MTAPIRPGTAALTVTTAPAVMTPPAISSAPLAEPTVDAHATQLVGTAPRARPRDVTSAAAPAKAKETERLLTNLSLTIEALCVHYPASPTLVRRAVDGDDGAVSELSATRAQQVALLRLPTDIGGPMLNLIAFAHAGPLAEHLESEVAHALEATAARLKSKAPPETVAAILALRDRALGKSATAEIPRNCAALAAQVDELHFYADRAKGVPEPDIDVMGADGRIMKRSAYETGLATTLAADGFDATSILAQSLGASLAYLLARLLTDDTRKQRLAIDLGAEVDGIVGSAASAVSGVALPSGEPKRGPEDAPPTSSGQIHISWWKGRSAGPQIKMRDQMKHNPGVAETTGRSILVADPATLLPFVGRGYPVGKRTPGEPAYREIIDRRIFVGYWVDGSSGTIRPTTAVVVHFDKKGGIHFIPAKPREW